MVRIRNHPQSLRISSNLHRYLQRGNQWKPLKFRFQAPATKSARILRRTKPCSPRSPRPASMLTSCLRRTCLPSILRLAHGRSDGGPQAHSSLAACEVEVRSEAHYDWGGGSAFGIWRTSPLNQSCSREASTASAMRAASTAGRTACVRTIAAPCRMAATSAARLAASRASMGASLPP